MRTLDQEFLDEFRGNATHSAIHLNFSDIEAHNSKISSSSATYIRCCKSNASQSGFETKN